MDPAWVIASISLVTVVVGLIAWSLRWAWRIGSRIIRFSDDYFGEHALPGRPQRPGVMERLDQLETGMADVRAQVHLNSGHSLKDTVERTERMIVDLQYTVDTLVRGQPAP